MNVYIIHSVGKVASTSIANALTKAGLNPQNGARVFKTHALNKETVAAVIRNNPDATPGHIIHSKEFLDLFQADKIDHSYVIIGEREPVARGISDFFQNINRYLEKPEVTMADMDVVMAELNVSMHRIMKKHENWWIREVHRVFDTNVFAFDFDKRSGVKVIELNEKVTFVLYNLERGMTHLPQVLRDITGKDDIEIGVVNTVADKKYFKVYQNHSEMDRLYKEVKARFKLPVSVLEGVYNDRVSRFFYDDEQIASFIERWKEPAGETNEVLQKD